jgi:hypothetical protein
MGNYSDIRAGVTKSRKAAKRKYAAGGRVAATKNGGKTTINIITAPAPSGPPPAMPPMPAPPPAPGGPGGGMPPAGAQAMQALGAGAPPAFKRGGRVKGGAASGVGRLQDAAAQKRAGKRGGGKVC